MKQSDTEAMSLVLPAASDKPGCHNTRPGATGHSNRRLNWFGY